MIDDGRADFDMQAAAILSLLAWIFLIIFGKE